MTPSQCDRIHAFLKDGKARTMREVHEAVGFCRLNSRISELRERGLTITCSSLGDPHNPTYQLVLSEDAGSDRRDKQPAAGPTIESTTGTTAPASSLSPVLGARASLLEGPPEQGVSVGASESARAPSTVQLSLLEVA